MRKIHFDIVSHGFYGCYFECKNKTDCGIIAMIGNQSDDHMARTCAKWLNELNINVLMMSIGKRNYSYHNHPIECIENAIRWLRHHGNEKIGIVGASTTGTLALTSASYFGDITLTIAFSPSDFIWQGFAQGNRDGCKEWPIENESLFTYRGKMLPYMPFCYKHPEYWNVIKAESKKNKDMINSVKLFDDSEACHPLSEEEMIKVEKINGKLILIGASDDALWDTARYIRRMKERLKNTENKADPEAYIYDHGTHYVFPESLIRMMLPFGSDLFLRSAFSACRKYPKECRETRIDIDRRVKNAICEWRCKR